MSPEFCDRHSAVPMPFGDTAHERPGPVWKIEESGTCAFKQSLLRRIQDSSTKHFRVHPSNIALISDQHGEDTTSTSKVVFHGAKGSCRKHCRSTGDPISFWSIIVVATSSVFIVIASSRARTC